MEARRPPSRTSEKPSPLSPRSASPAPSASSSSSSLSTTSTHTAVPRTPRPNAQIPRSMSGLTPSTSSVSVASDVTVTKRHESSPRTHHNKSTFANGSATIPSNLSSSPMFHPPRLEPPSASARPPGILALIRASLGPYLTSPRVTTFLLLFFLLPLVSLIMRIRRHRRTVDAGARLGAADVVRRRLANGQGQTVISRIWAEVVKAVGDTVRMGGGGLV